MTSRKRQAEWPAAEPPKGPVTRQATGTLPIKVEHDALAEPSQPDQARAATTSVGPVKVEPKEDGDAQLRRPPPKKYTRSKETHKQLRERLEAEVADGDRRLEEAYHVMIDLAREYKRLQAVVQGYKDNDQTLFSSSQMSQGEQESPPEDPQPPSQGGISDFGQDDEFGFSSQLSQLSQLSQPNDPQVFQDACSWLEDQDRFKQESNRRTLERAGSFPGNCLDVDAPPDSQMSLPDSILAKLAEDADPNSDEDALALRGVDSDSDASSDTEIMDNRDGLNTDSQGLDPLLAGIPQSEAAKLANAVAVLGAGAKQVVRVGVACMVTNPVGAPDCVLVGVRKGSHGAGTIALPGGHLEVGEAWADCAAREVLEETGLRVTVPLFTWITNDIMADGRHYVTIFMQAQVVDPRQLPQLLEPDKCAGWTWQNWSELITMARDELRRQALFLPLANILGISQIEGIDPFHREGA